MVRVIIIGGGFGGLNAAKALKRASVEVLVLDRMNHHIFQPLLYQVATAALSVGNIASPIREILRDQRNVTVLMEEVDHINKEQQTVHTAHGNVFEYDYLIAAPGARHSYFGHDQWESYAPGLKTAADALRIREHILLAFEKAERCENPLEAEKYLSFAIVGAGPTGVEMAGSIAEFAHRTLFGNFRRINPATSKIYLIEGTNQVLPSYPPKLSAQAQADLEKLGVDVLLNTIVTDINQEGVKMGNRFLPASTVIWAAGNEASPLLQTLNTPLDRQGRAIVNPDLTIPGYPNVFVIGDAAFCQNGEGQVLPAIAPVAIQQARYVAKMIKKAIPPKERKPFVYFDKGMMATIGRGKAVALFKKLQFSGFPAWALWGLIHIYFLIGFRDRILVLLQWMFWYFTGNRQVRIITKSIKKH